MTKIEGIYVEPLGCYLMVERSDELVRRIFFAADPPDRSSKTAGKIANYLQKGIPCQVELDLSNLSAFQRDVYSAISTIPRGKTTTYGEVASMLGRPSAARAVGRALRANPFAILIPCHRVLSKDGFGGYYWGLDLKKKLLDIEATNPG